MDDQPQRKKLSSLAKELREQTRIASDLEERLKEVNGRIHVIEFSELVDLMHELDCTAFSIPAVGNSPSFEFELATHYAASIAKDWEEPRREAAFAAVPDELVKITVKAEFAKGEAEDARALADELVTAGYTVVVEKAVHHSTLKAWLKEQFETGGDIPDLETIGAFIAPKVKVKEVKS
jgi:O-succinylbenzoate synthase